jgi:fumarylacetoacetase
VIGIDSTHDPQLQSWVESANHPDSDFPIQNLPFGVFRRDGDAARIGVAIGDQVLDLSKCAELHHLSGLDRAVIEACRQPRLNELLSHGLVASRPLRIRLGALLNATAPPLPELLSPMADVETQVPCEIGDYTDFYASIHHATNVGSMFRPDNPLLPNYKYMPIGYHGRASSIVPSGSPVRRPQGQVRDDASGPPRFQPTRLLDYELEVGFFVGPGNRVGEAIPIDQAGGRLFGACLLNDWSARDVQSWEYQPLGPFLAKSFATTVSPWVVTMDALAPFRIPAQRRPADDPAPLSYLWSEQDQAAGGFDISLEVFLSTERMRAQGLGPERLSGSTLAWMYWTPAQLLAHHSSNGCNLRPGDLLASGTVSGPTESERGCLLELTWRGTQPIQLPSGEQREFLEDGDQVIFRGYCVGEGFRRIGFGECRGMIVSASHEWSDL